MKNFIKTCRIFYTNICILIERNVFKEGRKIKKKSNKQKAYYNIELNGNSIEFQYKCNSKFKKKRKLYFNCKININKDVIPKWSMFYLFSAMKYQQSFRLSTEISHTTQK